MGFTFAKGLVLLIATASILALSVANKDWGSGWTPKGGFHHPRNTPRPNKIVVGGSQKWHFGYDYAKWAFQNGPFYVNDTLVFKFDLPNSTTPPHSVYLLPNHRSFWNCNLTGATMLANITDGGGNGFEFVLKKWWQPHYFACGEHDGIHCRDGKMKFFVVPLPRRHR